MSRSFIIASRSSDGTALLVVLVVLTLFLVVGGVVAAFATQQHRYIQREIDLTQARYAAEAGIYLAMSRLENDPAWQPEEEMTLVDGLSATVRLRPLGGFFEVVSVAEVRGQEAAVRAVLGLDHPLLEMALVHGDAGTALHVGGDTRVTGTVVVGPRGLQRGTLRGSSFRGRVDGSVQAHNVSPLPGFDPGHIETQLDWLDRALDAPPSEGWEDACEPVSPCNPVVRIEEDVVLDSLDSARWNHPVTLLVHGDAVLEGGFGLHSGSRVASQGSIHIRDDVGGHIGIVYGRRNVVIDGGRFSGQVLARDSVRAEAGSYLRHPSLLYVSGRTIGTERHGLIRLDAGATIDGSVIYPALEVEGQNDRGRIVIERGAVVRGAVYSAAQTQLRGTVHGTVLTHQFFHFASPQALINWLVDATISHPLRPEGFRLPIGLEDEPRLEVLKWEELEVDKSGKGERMKWGNVTE